MDAQHSAFVQSLQSSRRILAFIGAGLSASSGIPTYRNSTDGSALLWRGLNPAVDIANPRCLENDPVLFWHYYNYLRTIALHAQPNTGHRALAMLAKHRPSFLALTQNIDGPYAHACSRASI
jgi:NAD-dependent SIR2 family protein deacetylase